ncbi:MAG: DUF4397 domain-containing protein [Pedobacter sp.]|nr:MAG: DUF4397 domain-containing protein [Pedobacter sp.]
MILIMKKLSFYGLCFVVLLSSCVKKPAPEPVGEAKFRALNATSGSIAQDVYFNSNKVNIAPLAYGQVSAYQTILSGPSYFGFTDNGSTIANIEIPRAVKIGEHITVLYYSLPNGSKNVGFLVDDMVAPATGKAKVRFVNLNGFFLDRFSVQLVGGAPIVASLPYENSSAYAEVDAGATFKLLAQGLTSDPLINANIQAGKIYTFWVDGTATELVTHVMIQN